MTATIIPIPDYVTRERTIGDLAVIATDLLMEAASAALTLPRYLTINGTDELRMQFSGTPDLWEVLAAWADQYGRRQDIIIRVYDNDDGPLGCGSFTFIRQGVTVELCVYVRPPGAEDSRDG